jgi:hypothetical protein
MSHKRVRIENGKIIPSTQHDDEAVLYEVTVSKDTDSIYRSISYANKGISRLNRFDIDDRTKYGGVFTVNWLRVNVESNPEGPTKGGLTLKMGEEVVLDYRGDLIVNILVGEFQTLKEAELYAIKFAQGFGDVKPFYGYHPLFEKEDLTIEDIPMVFTWDEGSRPIQIKCPRVDKKVLQESKERAQRRLLEKEARLNGKEDTRIMVKVLLNINLNDLNEALASHLENEVSVIDGVGADGDSTYNVDEVDVKVESTGAIEATFYLERESGKFASADDLRAEIVNQIGANATVEIPIELVE